MGGGLGDMLIDGEKGHICWCCEYLSRCLAM